MVIEKPLKHTAPQKDKQSARQRREELAALWPTEREEDTRSEVEDLFAEAQELGSGGERWLLGAVLGVDDLEGRGGLTILSRPEQARRNSGLCPRCGCGRSGCIQCVSCLRDSRQRYARLKAGLGRGGREQGGLARAMALSPGRRVEIARLAAAGRWGYSGSALERIGKADIYARFDVRSTKSGYVVTDRKTGQTLPRKWSNRRHVESWCARVILQGVP